AVSDIESSPQTLQPDVAALVFPAARCAAWPVSRPTYSVWVPGLGEVKMPPAYPVAIRVTGSASILSTWIQLSRRHGTIDAAYRYWILGRDPAARTPRWSVIRDVLDWVDE